MCARIEQIFNKKYEDGLFYLAEYFKQNMLSNEIGELLKDLNPETLDDYSKSLLFSYQGYSHMYEAKWH